jgi:hypothetical protein
MKLGTWTNRLLCFVLGFVVASAFAFAVTSRSQDTVWREIAGMQQRLNALEQYNQKRERADREAAEAARREENNRNRVDRYT